MGKIIVEVNNIKWDTDIDSDLDDLPTEVTYTFSRNDFDCSDNELNDEVEELVADKLSDNYGYCHDGFEINIENKKS